MGLPIDKYMLLERKKPAELSELVNNQTYAQAVVKYRVGYEPQY